MAEENVFRTLNIKKSYYLFRENFNLREFFAHCSIVIPQIE